MTRRNSLRARAFLKIGALSALLPHFRGRTRIFLELYRLLHLKDQHVIVRTGLRRPVDFNAELDLHSWLQKVAFLTGGYEPDTVEFLLRLHRAGGGSGYLLDVGANIGLISIPFVKATSGPSPRAIAVEAVPDNVRALRNNVSLNELTSQLTVVPVALGDEPGWKDIQVEGDLQAGEGTGTANILADGSLHPCVRQKIQLQTLDELASAGTVANGCSVIKIDTDGYDLKVLQGGTQFLQRERPMIFGEYAAHCMAWHGQDLAQVQTFCEQLNYEVWRRVMPGWRFSLAASGSDFIQDLLLVPRERRIDFEQLLVT